MEAFTYASEYKGAELYLFRETFDQLEANLIREWKNKIPKELYTYHESKHIATLFNGSKVFFRFVKNKSDAEGYTGREMAFIGVDELTKHLEETIQEIMSCLRSAQGYPVRFRATCNPGGVGHVWVKKRYINPTNKGENEYIDNSTGSRIAFIPARVYDNPIIMKNDPKYVKRLENLSPAKRKAFLEGDWDAYDGQAFEEFRVDTHVCKPFPIPEHWFRWMGHDPGYTDPFSWHWFAVGEDGTVYVYREYTREYDDPKITYSDQAKRVVQLSERATLVHGQEVMQPENISYCATGVDAWNTHPLAEVGKTINDFYVEGGLRNCTRAITDRKLRKAVWHEYLSPYFHPIVGRNIAKIQIFSNCKRLIETIPQQLEDENDVEKVMQTDYDHQFDSAGYGLVSYHMNKSHTITTPLTGDAKRIDDHIESLIRKREKTHFKRYSVG